MQNTSRLFCTAVLIFLVFKEAAYQFPATAYEESVLLISAPSLHFLLCTFVGSLTVVKYLRLNSLP